MFIKKIEVLGGRPHRGRISSLRIFSINRQTLWVFEILHLLVKCLIQLSFIYLFMKLSRRVFIKKSSYAALAAGVLSHLPSELFSQSNASKRKDLELYGHLLKQWCDALIEVQVKDKNAPETYGGFMCPSCGFIHGRCADAVYPLLYMADITNDQRYLNSALQVFNWAEHNVSMPDGSWINDHSNPWKGITVFGASALGESLKHHSHLLDNYTHEQWLERMRKACDFIYSFITVDTSNINYPLCASYPLVLGGKLLQEQKFIDRGYELAQVLYKYLTPEAGFIYGELKPRTQSTNGYWPVDLSYNVEETLPTLTLYALEMQDEKMLDIIVQSWKTHIEFMLPDGGWDNSFGTRNHKWTYWGSRNSDGCQAGLALLGKRNPVFAESAYRNAQMLEKCTHNGILYGGPGYFSHGVKPCIHHTFAHAKSLAALLDKNQMQQEPFPRTKLPREETTGIKIFKDIATHLISVGKWRATITASDCEYKESPHASGGSLALLYHEDIGLLLTDSLIPELRLREPSNMQDNDDALKLLLTPRLEIMVKNISYRSSRDIGAKILSTKFGDGVHVVVQCNLVSHDQKDPPNGSASFEFNYIFRTSDIEIRAINKTGHIYDDLVFYLPIISSNNEKINCEASDYIIINKTKGILKITTSGKLKIMDGGKTRVFSQSPGVEALPVKVEWDSKNSTELKINIIALS